MWSGTDEYKFPCVVPVFGTVLAGEDHSEPSVRESQTSGEAIVAFSWWLMMAGGGASTELQQRTGGSPLSTIWSLVPRTPLVSETRERRRHQKETLSPRQRKLSLNVWGNRKAVWKQQVN